MILRKEVWVRTTNLTLPLFIEVPVPSQENERLCACNYMQARGNKFSSYQILELFRQCFCLFVLFCFVCFVFAPLLPLILF